ncbi:MAG TPA: rhomboid family intramembrane serine protease [Deltaproteobacteria bacterium]|nr:rhomboid family intramembrane serine protease [Deltaproteobacteria bacterium]
MIPLRDTTPSRSHPVVNNALIVVNGLLFLVQLTQGAGLDRFIYIYGLVPARYSIPQVSSYFTSVQQLVSFISFMFLHGGFWHLVGNMWSLYIFGDNVEDHMGHMRYLLFYLLSGLASGITHLIFNYYSNVPTIGASGAIAGVMGAYFILHPGSRILTLIPVLFIPLFIEIPAFFFIAVWFVLQVVNAAGSDGSMGGIAWWAHIGGFLLGIAILKGFDMFFPVEKPYAATRKKHSHRLHVVQPRVSPSDANLYGTIRITWYEALTGARKLVNVPWGFKKRLIRVTIPPGIEDGKSLRLKGLGKELPHGERGDLYLKVVIESK